MISVMAIPSMPDVFIAGYVIHAKRTYLIQEEYQAIESNQTCVGKKKLCEKISDGTVVIQVLIFANEQDREDDTEGECCMNTCEEKKA